MLSPAPATPFIATCTQPIERGRIRQQRRTTRFHQLSEFRSPFNGFCNGQHNATQQSVVQFIRVPHQRLCFGDHLRDRGFIYWRLLCSDPDAAKAVVLAELAMPTTDAAVLSAGEVLADAKCVRCHEMEAPAAYGRGDWEDILPEMLRESRVDATEARAISAWVLAGAGK